MKIKVPKISQVTNNFLIAVKLAVMYTSLFILLFFDSAFCPANNFPGTLKLVINISAVIGLAVTTTIVLKIKKRLLFLLLLYVFTMLLSGLLFSNLKQTLILIICITMGFTVANFVRYSRFKRIYRNFMLFLAIFSLVTFAVSFLFPSLISALPIAKNDTLTYRNAIFSVIATNDLSIRNYGFFWEPGAFAIFLNIALLFEMTDKSQNIVRLLIFAVAIVTTLSTLGIICLAILIAVYVFNNSYNVQNYKRNRTILISISLIAVAFVLLRENNFIYNVFGKLKPSESGKINFSTQSRINAVIYPFKDFLSSPIIGVGYNQYMKTSTEYCNDMATCTFINWISIYGIFGLPLIYGCIKFFLRHGRTVISKVGLLMFSLLLFSTENFLLIGFVYIFVFYGFSKTDRNLSNTLSAPQETRKI